MLIEFATVSLIMFMVMLVIFSIPVLERYIGIALKHTISFAITTVVKFGSHLANLPGCRENILHKWNYSWSWNGGWDTTRRQALGRKGHRCYHCGEMRWDETDNEYFAANSKQIAPKILQKKLPRHILSNLGIEEDRTIN